MNVEEAKKALLNKNPVIISRPLMGDVFQGCVSGITMRAPKDSFVFYVETMDAVAKSVTVSGIEDVRYATDEEIEDYIDQYSTLSKIKPQINYEVDPRQTVYKAFKNMSLRDMAVFLTKTFIMSNQQSQETATADRDIYNQCLKATIKFLESEVTKCQLN